VEAQFSRAEGPLYSFRKTAINHYPFNCHPSAKPAVAVLFVIPRRGSDSAVAVVFVVAVILNAVKDPEEFHSPQLLELFNPPLSQLLFRSFPKEHETGSAKNKFKRCGMFLAAK
jgi:hypothetical protein